jgi:hypothetical protein
MGTKLFLGETAMRAGIRAIFTSGSDSKEDCPYEVQSPARVEACQTFVAVLERAAPGLMTEHMHDMFLLCTEIGFIGP